MVSKILSEGKSPLKKPNKEDKKFNCFVSPINDKLHT